jgi:hypothetical protein
MVRIKNYTYTTQNSYFFLILASTERGEPLRKLLLPKGVHSRFLSIADRNTRNKIETCGILAGTLVKINKKKSNSSKMY